MFKVFKGGQLPTRGTKYSACVDLYANEDVVIGAGETVLVPLGVCIDEDSLYRQLSGIGYFDSETKTSILLSDFKKSHYLQLMLRSSLSKDLIIANGVGVVDLDYRDEIMVRVHNPLDTYKTFEYDNVEIKKGDRVAQIALLEHKSYLFGIDTEDERTGGFGSTNKKDGKNG